MDAEISLLHRHIRPNARDQLLLTNNFSCAFDQRNKRVERPAPQLGWLVPFFELPFGRKQAEKAKRDDAAAIHALSPAYDVRGIVHRRWRRANPACRGRYGQALGGILAGGWRQELCQLRHESAR